MVERIERSADFERVLRTPTRARSLHFAAHHVGGSPSLPAQAAKAALAAKLSTTDLPAGTTPVDDSVAKAAAPAAPTRRWFGLVVPKRHARRSVTRSLLKRQIRAAVARQGAGLEPGLWVIRLRAPFDVAQFPSARSTALQAAARLELEHLLTNAAQSRARSR